MNQNILLSNAIQSYASGQWDESEKLLRQVLDLIPNHPKALYFLGIIALSKGIMEEACHLLYTATLADPHNKDYQYSLAVALQESGKLDEAITRYEKIADMAESQNNLGNIYRMKSDLEKAREAFDNALKINPNMTWAYVNKAILERSEGNSKAALDLLEKALQIEPDFIQALYQLSVENRLNKNFNKSIELIEKAIKLNSSIDFIWVEYGKVLNELKRSDEALNAFEKAIELNRFCTDAYFEKAALLENKNPTLSEQAYRDVLRIDTNNTAAYNNLGSLLYRQNRVMEALEMYRNVFIIKPDDTSAAFNLAIALEDLQNFEEAAGLYFKILGQKQLQQEVHLRLANLLPAWFETQPQMAKTYAAGWLKHFPDNPLAIHTNNALNGMSDSDDMDFAYTQTFYNAFADSYDEKMSLLKCQIPVLIEKEIAGKNFENVLDLGCGTGACGKFLKAKTKHLTGVDASQKMIEKADQRQLYDTLKTQDVLDFLQNTTTQFDLIIAADVFCYINKLNNIFKEAHKSLSHNGQFIFTVEKNEKDNKTRLQSNGRYQHAPKTIIKQLNSAGFKNINVKDVILREENNQPCNGLLFSIRH